MSSVLADFTARFTVESDAFDGPAEGRVLLGNDRLVLAASDEQKETIPLSSVVDVALGSVPSVFDPLPGEPVTVVYASGEKRVAALVTADESTIEKFITVLFKAMLNGNRVTVKHPAKLGGRVMDTEFQGGLLTFGSGAVKIETDEGPIEISLNDVIDFSRESRTVDGAERPVVVVDHMQTGDALTTVVATESARELTLLGRLIRRQYEKRMAKLEQLSLSESETEVLTTVYSAGDRDISLSSVLGVEPKQAKRLVHALHGKGLIESGENGYVLTPNGQIVVNEYLERVNA